MRFVRWKMQRNGAIRESQEFGFVTYGKKIGKDNSSLRKMICCDLA